MSQSLYIRGLEIAKPATMSYFMLYVLLSILLWKYYL